jgi:hypothetical protein
MPEAMVYIGSYKSSIMKLLIAAFSLLFVSTFTYGQTVVPELNHQYVTSDLGYSGCKNEMTLKKVLQAAAKLDNETFMAYHNSGDCLVIAGNMRVRVLNITFDGNIVELKSDGMKSSLWTVPEVLTAN